MYFRPKIVPAKFKLSEGKAEVLQQALQAVSKEKPVLSRLFSAIEGKDKPLRGTESLIERQVKTQRGPFEDALVVELIGVYNNGRVGHFDSRRSSLLSTMKTRKSIDLACLATIVLVGSDDHHRHHAREDRGGQVDFLAR
ncbi:uncharacterized protein PADG_00021 [Paracoccidioides brasiliensis Pb18]|uniref:Uncharacterized protein n=1 Tax=Paracoccidioides brasiliensis (strain Pb18) TaxID=502780 RepID=C1FZI1_PARBD|nr:uncharacterized protein PADG_00021 [Paracoccidioides brasiliensis Pb18]EEH43732.2 hypothetical protein PADG_00021 [Paracoccidioides brasiliensis Pb18]